MVNHELNIRVWIEDESTCHRCCPFLEGDKCLLFSQELDETVLPKDHVWQDDTEPTRQRCHRCKMATE